LQHSEAKIALVDGEFAPLMPAAGLRVLDIDGDYEAFIADGDPQFPVRLPDDEWQAIALNYPSGTTGNPKGIMLRHRGAYLNAVGNALTFGLSPRSVYLWTLPMFHCNGWTYTPPSACGGPSSMTWRSKRRRRSWRGKA
jgi:fatty-acyl-CoA synthase